MSDAFAVFQRLPLMF